MSGTEYPAGLAEQNLEAADDDGYEWGQYVERHDGGSWTPLVYSSEGDREHSEWGASRPDIPELFRNRRLIRRRVAPWEIVPAAVAVSGEQS